MKAETNSLAPSFVVFQVGTRRVALSRESVAELIASPLLFFISAHNASSYGRRLAARANRSGAGLGAWLAGRAISPGAIFPGCGTEDLEYSREVRHPGSRGM